MTNFKDALNNLAPVMLEMKETILSEEGTKTALIMPMLQVLGYNVFNPTEVRPEMIHDTTGKNRERVDFGISINNNPVMLLEAKKVGSKLCNRNINQLYRYFNQSPARIGILTDGITYMFFSDVDNDNMMDGTPFFKFDFENYSDDDVTRLEMFTKSSFNVNTIIDKAMDLKYKSDIHAKLMAELESPSEEFVKAICGDIAGGGKFSKKRREHMTQLTSAVTKDFIKNEVANRLKKLMNDNANTSNEVERKIEEPIIIAPANLLEPTQQINQLPQSHSMTMLAGGVSE